MFGYVVGLAVGGVVVWFAVANAWASSVAKHNPDLREGVGQVRYGWRCPKCGRMEAPSCTVNKCGGPLVWVQQGAKIKCARCHRILVAHPMLFREAPRPRTVRCRQCGWSGKMSNFKLLPVASCQLSVVSSGATYRGRTPDFRASVTHRHLGWKPRARW